MTTPRKKRNQYSVTEHNNYRRGVGNRRDAQPGTCTFTIEEEEVGKVSLRMTRKHVTTGGRVVNESQRILLDTNSLVGLNGWIRMYLDKKHLRAVS